MSKKKQATNSLPILRKDELGMNYLKSLENDPKYQIEVDPTGFYGMDEEQKLFVKLFIEYRNLPIIAEIMNLQPAKVKEYFTQYSTQQEIRRINAALYHRQVATNIIAFEDLGSYLSSWLIGTDIPEADRLRKGEKIQVVKLLMDWHKAMREILQKPEILTIESIEEEIKELSIANIKQLISTKSLLNSMKVNEKSSTMKTLSNDKQELISQLNVDNALSQEELKYLESLSVKELLSLLKEE